MKESFGLTQFRDLQREAINASMSNRDVLVIMPTGGGKSLCYQLPAAVSSGVTIVISPLLALMDDQTAALTDLGIGAAFFSGNQTGSQAKNMMNDMMKLKYKLVYVTPEKVTKSKTFQKYLQKLYERQQLERFVVDEAHCVSTWGHDFRPDYRTITQIKRQFFPKTPTIALTATATQQVIQDIVRNLGFRDRHIILKGSFNRPNLVYHVKSKGTHDVTMKDIVTWINANHANECGIVYCLSKKDTEKVSEALNAQKIRAAPYHAGMEPDQRMKVAGMWRQDKIKVIVATVAFGMGIDKPDVRFVIHHSFPKSIEDYYQASGRAGRDGGKSDCVLYYGSKDRTRNVTLTTPDPNSLDALNRIVNYCEAISCRRAILIQHFGEPFDAKDCNKHCDNCMAEGEVLREDVSEDARNLLRVIEASRGKCTLAICLLIWRGSQNKKITESKYNALDGFGTGKSVKLDKANRISSQLLATGYIREARKGNAYGTWSLVSVNVLKARKMLKGKEQFFLETRTIVKPQPVVNTLTQMAASSSKNDELRGLLSELRGEISREVNVPPYVIIPEQSLLQLIEQKPTTIDALHSIVQFGNEKIVKYGLRIVQAIRQFLQEPLSADEMHQMKQQVEKLATESIRPTGTSLIANKEEQLKADEYDDDLQDLIDAELKDMI